VVLILFLCVLKRCECGLGSPVCFRVPPVSLCVSGAFPSFAAVEVAVASFRLPLACRFFLCLADFVAAGSRVPRGSRSAVLEHPCGSIALGGLSFRWRLFYFLSQLGDWFSQGRWAWSLSRFLPVLSEAVVVCFFRGWR